MVDSRRSRYESSLRRYYKLYVCRDVNDPQRLLRPGNTYYWEHQDTHSDWRQRISEDPTFPVHKVAQAIKNCVGGSEERNLETFKKGSDLLLEMEHKYRPRAVLTTELLYQYDNGNEPKPILSTLNGGQMIGFRFGYGLYCEPLGEITDTFDPLEMARLCEYFGLNKESKETPLFLDQDAVEQAASDWGIDPEMVLYRIRQLENPEWHEEWRQRQEKEDAIPTWNMSIRLFREFRKYLRQDQRIMKLGICHHPGCGKLYVKSKHASSTQRYCPRHQQYHHS